MALIATAGAAAAAAGLAGCAGTSVSVEPDATALASKVTVVVELPVSMGYGGAAEQHRIQRRTGDALIALAGGRAILADELPSPDGRDLQDKEIADAVRALGEDPSTALTFAVLASRTRRTIANSSPIPGFNMGRRLVIDYIVRVEVRQAGRADVIGTVDGVAAADPNEADQGPRGESLGVQKAIEEAVAKAVHAFAPRLESRATPAVIAEVPAAAAGAVLKRLQAVQELYPELSMDEMQAFSAGGERLMVVRPGPLAALGLAAGDFLSAPAGHALTSRAALARQLARGDALLLVVARGGQRYLLADRAKPVNVASGP